MNIVKLKDIIMPDECKLSKFFNTSLKGKYAYWIQMRYIFPLESLDFKKYIQFEQLDPADFLDDNMLTHIDLYSEECSMYNFAQNYIDHEITESINNINEYKLANEYVVDFNVDIEKLKVFRSWLAGEILSLSSNVDGTYNGKLSENEIHVLEFYKNDMYNDVIKHLTIFGNDDLSLLTTKTGCACCSTTNTLLNNLALPNVCRPIEIYTKNLHNLMVQTFEDVNFWAGFNVEFIKLFKLYIDNIIKAGFVFSTDDTLNLYKTCKCNSSTVHTTILQNLSISLEYIINDEISTHRNFIHDSLYTWAENLYDLMYWK